MQLYLQMTHPDRSEPKIILYDLETLPNMDSVMEIFPSLSEYPGQTLKASINSIICFGYTEFGSGKINCINAWDFKGWKKNVNDDRELMIKIRQIITSADAVVTHNGKRFDHKFIQTRLLGHGMDPLPKIPHIDTCQVSKSNLLMYNNRLNTIAKFMTSEEKLENGGWALWKKVMARDKKSMELMEKYCKQDVNVLLKVFKKLRPLIKNIPNYNLFSAIDIPVCSNCGSTRVVKNGTRVQRSGHMQIFICKDCGSVSQRKSDTKMLNTF